MDDKERQTIYELQDTLIGYTHALKVIANQIQNKKSNLKIALLTKQEIASLPDDTVTYNAVGKAYFCSPKSDVVNRLDAMTKSHATEIDNLMQKETSINQKLRQSEEEFREFLAQSPAYAERLVASS